MRVLFKTDFFWQMHDDQLDRLIASQEIDQDTILQLGARFITISASSNADQIQYYFDKVRGILQQHPDDVITLPLLTGIEGVTLFYLTQYEEAEQKLNEALTLIKEETPSDIEGFIRMALGANYRSLGQIDLAVENLLLAPNLLDKDGYFKIYYAYSLYQLGEIHLAIGEYENARNYYQEALSVIITIDQSTANFRVYNGLGICFLHLEQYDESLSYLNKALAVKGISPAEEARGLCDLGVLHLKMQENEKAEDFLYKSYQIRFDNNLEDAASTSLIHMGEVSLALKNTKEAIEYLEQAEKITTKFKAIGKKIKVLHLLGEAYQQMGQHARALEYFVEYDELNDKIRSEQKRKIFNLKNNQIERQKQLLESQNVVLNQALQELKEARNSKISLFYSIITVIVLVVLSEAFIEPLIEQYSDNHYIGYGVKALMALMLKPLESLYDRILFRKAMRRVD